MSYHYQDVNKARLDTQMDTKEKGNKKPFDTQLYILWWSQRPSTHTESDIFGLLDG